MSKSNEGRSGAVRQKALSWADLANMERHGKREDESGKARRVREEDPLVHATLEVREARDAHMQGVARSKGAQSACLHALVQFPTQLIDGNDEQQQRRMLDHAVRFMNDFHGGAAVFAARLDRDEKGQHSVDVFLMPTYEREYADGRKVRKAAVSRWTKAAAKERYGKTDRRSQGSALQDAWYEYMRDEMCLDGVLPPERKKATAKDRVEPEEYGLRKDREKHSRRVEAHQKQVERHRSFVGTMADMIKRRAEKIAKRREKLDAEREAFEAEKRRASSALEAAQQIAEQQQRQERSRELAAHRQALEPVQVPEQKKRRRRDLER